jgi:hypothetical protein
VGGAVAIGRAAQISPPQVPQGGFPEARRSPSMGRDTGHRVALSAGSRFFCFAGICAAGATNAIRPEAKLGC